MTSALSPAESLRSALLNTDWWAWNEAVWGIRAEEVCIAGERAGAGLISGAVFKNRRGRVVNPPLNPHLPLGYAIPNAKARREDSQSRMWVEVADQLSDSLTTAGIANSIALPPGLLDARPFTWKGLRAGLSYTYLVELPRDATRANTSVGQKIRKAMARGYYAERSDDWQAIWSCLTETEASKGFSHRLALADLRLGADIMGVDSFRGYVVRDATGQAVSGGVRLHSPGHRALDWVQGTLRPALADGVNQLMYDFVMSDLSEAGAIGFDLAGANIREVALAKSSWGYPLVPYVTLEPAGLLPEVRRSLARSARTRRAVHRARDFVQSGRSWRTSGGDSE